MLHTKPMTRPCSIARGNCEPKTIKYQIYDTDQFTMIWRKTVLPFFIHFFLRIFFLLSLKKLRLGEWYKKRTPGLRCSMRRVNQKLTMLQNAMGIGKASEQHEMQRTTVEAAGEGGGGEVKAGVATRWLIPSSISSRSNCWTLLNMTYLWSASCGTKGEAKLQLGNAQWKW